MKRSTVPAQITTVEDRVVGGLTPYQLALIMFPFCIGFLSYAVFPPNFHLALYKLIVVVVLEVIGAVLSVRIKDKMLLFWIITRVRYNVRPRYHVYNKNDGFLRDVQIEKPVTKKVAEKKTVEKASELPKLAMPEMVRLEGIMSDPRANMHFRAGKDGRLNVVIQEIK